MDSQKDSPASVTALSEARNGEYRQYTIAGQLMQLAAGYRRFELEESVRWAEVLEEAARLLGGDHDDGA